MDSAAILVNHDRKIGNIIFLVEHNQNMDLNTVARILPKIFINLKNLTKHDGLYAVHSVNHVIALNKRKHSIVLKYAKEARSNGVLHVQTRSDIRINGKYINCIQITDVFACLNVLYKHTMFVNELG